MDSHRNKSTLQRLSLVCPRKLSHDGLSSPGNCCGCTDNIRLTTSLLMNVPNAILICCAIRGHPKLGLRRFISITASMICWEGPFGPGFEYFLNENSCRYLHLVSRAWNANRVEGRRMTAARSIWRGMRNNVQNARENRSVAVNLGARRRDRRMISSCCFISKLSATIAFAPPGPSNLAMVTTKCMNSRKIDFIVGRIMKATTKNKTTQIFDFQ